MRESTVDRIADAALRLLIDEGAAAVTMRRVAAAAGVTPMATYKHFANREALLRAVAGRGFAEVTKGWATRGDGLDFEATVHALAEDFLDFALGMPHLYAFLVTDRREQARRFPDDFADGSSVAFTPIMRAVERGMREGLLAKDNPPEVTLALTAGVQGLVQQYAAGRIGLSEKDFRALCMRTVARTLDGLRA